MGGDVDVRRAVVADLAGLLELYARLAEDRVTARPAGAEEGARILREIVADPRRELLVAVGDGVLVGTVDAVIVPNLTHGGRPWAIVENVVVDEDTRRAGIGTRLMTELERRVAAADCYKLQLLSRKHRAGAHAFYESVGFTAAAEGFRRYLD